MKEQPTELNKLRSAWKHHKPIQNLDTISERQLNEIINRDLNGRKKRSYTVLIKYSMIHSLLLVVCQSY